MKNKKILSPLLLILFLAGVLLLILGLILNGRNERTGTDKYSFKTFFFN